jgi:hypothetical protein
MNITKKEDYKMRDVKKRVNGELDFEVYHFVFETAIEIFEEIFEASKNFPKEKFYLTDQVRKNSRMVCTSLADAWRMKENIAIFIIIIKRCDNLQPTCLDLPRSTILSEETFKK